MSWRRTGGRRRRLRVATWNIRHGAGLDGEVDLERVAATIRSLRADVIGLQELDRGRDRSGRVDQPARLVDLIGMEVFFRPTVVSGGGEYGLALASSGEISAVFESLPGEHGEEPRGVLVGRTLGLSVLVTHLSRHDASRRLQLERLAVLAGGVEPPVVLVGDLNQGRRGLGPLRRAGLGGPRRRVRTAPAHRALRQIDHVLAGRGATVEKTWATPSSASDHLPLVGWVVV